MSMTLHELRMLGRKKLDHAGIEGYMLDADVLLMHAAGITKNELLTKNEMSLSDEVCTIYNAMIEKRMLHFPAQYLTGMTEFMSLDFMVNTSVLVPRNDTEILAEKLIDTVKDTEALGLEMGVGSGCISVSTAFYCKNCRLVSVDISEDAIETAKKNAVLHCVSERIQFVLSDMFTEVPADLIGSIDFIVSNPPYIPTLDIQTLGDNVKLYEPHIALDGGSDGLNFYRTISHKGHPYLKNGGNIFYEIGYNQAKEVFGILQSEGFTDINVIKDLAGLDRVVCAKK